MPATPLPWHLLATEQVLDLAPWFSVVKDVVQLPSGRIVDDYYRIQAPDYVLIAARRDDGTILMERHYKHCLGRVILTSPAGSVDQGETPLEAACRELLEETGFVAWNWSKLGSFVVDGTRGICTAHLFLAEGLRQDNVPEANDMEEFELTFLTPNQIRQAFYCGEIPLLPDLALLSYLFDVEGTQQEMTEPGEVKK